MTAIRIQPRARLDLLEQAEYYAERADIELAFRFQECAESTFALLAAQPQMGKPSRSRLESLGDVREFPVRNSKSTLSSISQVQEALPFFECSMGHGTLTHCFERTHSDRATSARAAFARTTTRKGDTLSAEIIVAKEPRALSGMHTAPRLLVQVPNAGLDLYSLEKALHRTLMVEQDSCELFRFASCGETLCPHTTRQWAHADASSHGDFEPK